VDARQELSRTAAAVTTSPVLEVGGLTAGYGGPDVIRDISLSVHRGEVVALLGPNGAGKTTTLWAISGLVRYRGSVQLDGNDIGPLSTPQRANAGIAHVPQGRGVFSGLTVDEHFRLDGVSDSAQEAFDKFPALAKLRDRRAGLLSGGEQQMLAISRALLTHPKVMLLDELSMGLAPIIVERLLPFVRAAADEQGVAVLLVEQHVHLALEIADRGYVLSHGELAIADRADRLRADNSLVAASYLGEQHG
jgi:ABC-type branched-subunit amino acid transport system ATPase component